MAIKPFNSVAGFSVGETPANIILANGRITTNGADFTANITALGVLTDNLYYANGTPWDLSDPGGSNTAIQFNDDESFGGSAAFTFDKVQAYQILPQETLLVLIFLQFQTAHLT